MDSDHEGNEDNNSVLYDAEQIKSLDLETLRKLLVVCDSKQKSNIKKLESLEFEKEKNEQMANSLRLKLSELKTHVSNLGIMDKEINERENRVVREAAKFKHVPLYEYKIDKFLKDLMESKNDNKDLENLSDMDQEIDLLLKRKEKLQTQINQNENAIKEFAKKYMNF